MTNRILIIDDEPKNLDVLHNCLREAGFKVLIAESGEAALQRIAHTKPDLILLDINMPGIDGYETCRRLKNNELSKDTPVIFVTAETETVDTVRGLEMGAADYITKPFQPEEVAARIEKHLTIRNLQKRLEEQNAQLQQEIAERKQVEKALKESQQFLRRVLHSSVNGIYIYNLKNGQNDYINQQYTRLTGFTLDDINGMNKQQFAELFHPEDRSRVFEHMGEIVRAEDEETIAIEYRFRTKDRRWIWCLSWDSVFERDNVGDTTRFIGSFIDITEGKQAEDRIKAALREKEVMLAEIHHRVKNNMQVISSLLKLQSAQIEDKKYTDMFKDSENRIKSMALVHETLYQSKDFANVDFNGYVEAITNHLIRNSATHPDKIKLKREIEDITFGLDHAIPCGLIINELITNSLKHAFPKDREGEIKITFRSMNSDEIELTVSDDGIGIPEEMDIRETKSLGLQLVHILAEDQLEGTLELDRDGGTAFRIRFKEAHNENPKSFMKDTHLRIDDSRTIA